MTCVHLQQLHQLCLDNKLQLSSSDLIHIVCHQCNKVEVCPAMPMENYDKKYPDSSEATTATEEPTTR